ncbi:MAG: radical SAM protein [Proteobacteria bacterium]|nr:radical SAM protein [Pseudomonadota bacterium]
MIKKLRSTDYNYNFNTQTGFLTRWGRTFEDDPQLSPFGPEILDIEVSTICKGIGSGPCTHCYKSNTPRGKNMSFETFKIIFDKMTTTTTTETLTQIAFGIGDIDSNPDLFKMFEYCRMNNVAPNLTINGYGLTHTHFKLLKSYCGAIAVSRYNPSDVCYDAVKTLSQDMNMDQINIHMLVSKETLKDCYQVIDDSLVDPRLDKLNAIVFLHLKPKGIRNTNTIVTQKEYQSLIEYAFSKNIRIGFDSCSAHKFINSITDSKLKDKLELFVEPCESGLFSSYINVDGRYIHCSFTEGEGDWKGIDVINSDDFIKDVWNGEETIKFRDKLLKQNRKCPIFNLGGEGDCNENQTGIRI